MRLVILIPYFLFSILSVFSNPKIDTIFYNENWEITSRQKAHYYRISDFDIQNKCFDGLVLDYYLENNKIHMIGYYVNCRRDSTFSFFYNDNHIDSIFISYNKGIPIGTWISYGNKGKIIKECYYADNNVFIINLSDKKESQIVNGNGKFYESRIYNRNGKSFSIRGQVKDSLKVGKWQIRNSRGRKVIVDRYKNGEKVKRRQLIENNEPSLVFWDETSSICTF